MISLLFFYASFVFCIVGAIRNTSVYIFVLYQAYYFFNPSTKWWGALIPNISFSFYIVLTLLIITAFSWGKLKENKLGKIPQFWFLYLMIANYAAVSLIAVFPESHMTALDYLATVTVLITVVYKLVKTEKELNLILWGYIIFAGYLGYYISQIGRTSSGRFQGAGMVDAPDGNGVAAAIAPTLVLCLYYFWIDKKLINRIGIAIIGAFLANALVQLGSRGAFLGVGASVGMFFYAMYFSKKRMKNQRLSVVFLLMFGGVGAITVTDDIFWSRITSMATQVESDATEKETGATRFIFWKGAWEMAKDYPFGQGSRSFLFYSPIYIPSEVDTGKKRNRAVHSTWFEALTEIGYLGLISLIGVIYYSLSTTKKAAKRLKEKGDLKQYFKVVAIRCSLICFIVSMTFLNRLRGEILYWCILYCAIAYNIYYLKPLGAEQSEDVAGDKKRPIKSA